MGIFTDVTKVKSLFRKLKIKDETGDEKTNSVITTEELNEFIDETEVAVRAKLSTCYDITNIGSESTTIIGMIVKWKVASTIQDIMALTTRNSDSKTQEFSGNWSKKANELLQKICPDQISGESKQKPLMPLPDTPLLSEAPVKASLFSSPVNAPVFKKGTPNW